MFRDVVNCDCILLHCFTSDANESIQLPAKILSSVQNEIRIRDQRIYANRFYIATHEANRNSLSLVTISFLPDV